MVKRHVKDAYEELMQIKISALFLQVCMMSTDIGESVAAQEEFEQVVDSFRERFGEWINPAQSEAARRDVDLFVSILQPALAHYRDLSAGGGETEPGG